MASRNGLWRQHDKIIVLECMYERKKREKKAIKIVLGGQERTVYTVREKQEKFMRP